MRFLLPLLLVSCGGYIEAPLYWELGETVEQFEDGAVVEGFFDEDAGAFGNDEYALQYEDDEDETPEIETETPAVQQALAVKGKFDNVDAGTFTCKYGGTVTVTRTDVPPLLQLDWTFTACADKKDKTTDGTVNYQYHSDTVTVTYDATLTYTGKDAGTCVLTSEFTGKMAEKFKKHLCKIPKIKK